MNQALLLNLAIIACIAAGMIYLQNPLALFGLLLLKELPYGLLVKEDEEEPEGKPIGFTSS